MTRRRTVLTLAALGAGPGWAQQPPPRRIARLFPGTEAASAPSMRSYTQAFAEAGWLLGRDYIWDVRYADFKPEREPALAAELLAAKPALLIALGRAAVAAMSVGSDVPLVVMGNPASMGLAQSERRPGGRITGVGLFTSLNAKRTELLGELVPKGSRVLLLGDLDMRANSEAVAQHTAAAVQAGLVPRFHFAGTAAELEAGMRLAAREGLAGVNQFESPALWAVREVSFRLALQLKLPVIYQWAEAASEGGLMAYGPRINLLIRQLVRMAVRVLNGEKPAQMPLEQPTEVQLALNEKVAAQIGVKFPAALRVRADEVVQ